MIRNNSKLKIQLSLLAIAINLVACGGGGGSSSTPAAASSTTTPASASTSTSTNTTNTTTPPASTNTPSAEGAYMGTIPELANSGFTLLVLENGEFWALYGSGTASSLTAAGMVTGTGSSANGAFTSTNANGYFNSDIGISASINATYSSTAIGGTLSSAIGSAKFVGVPIPTSLYNYNTPATLASIAGKWTMMGLTKEPVTINIQTTGEFNAVSAYGCTFSGTFTPRPSGKNVFNFNMKFGPSPCTYAGKEASGVALSTPVANGQTQLAVAGTDPTKTLGSAMIGVR